jgi:hypothetical protein
MYAYKLFFEKFQIKKIKPKAHFLRMTQLSREIILAKTHLSGNNFCRCLSLGEIIFVNESIRRIYFLPMTQTRQIIFADDSARGV